MDWLSTLLKKKPAGTRYAPTLDAFTPIYSQFGTNVYASDVVQQAVKCIVDEMRKLTPMHVRYEGSDPIPVKGAVQNVLDDPNPLMTTTEFIEKTMWMLLLNYNAFIIPTYYQWSEGGEKRRQYEALYPINPLQVNFIEDASGRLYVNFVFRNGKKTTIPYDDVIHLKYNYSVSQYMGGDEAGQPNNKSIADTLTLNEELLAGIAKAMKASYAINGVVKYKTLMDDGAVANAIDQFQKWLQTNESGILPLDLKAEFTPLERKAQIVNSDALKFIDAKILRNWGVSPAILSGEYTKEDYEAFYQKALEPLIRSVTQAFTKKLFTRRERAFGNRIEFYPEDLVFMTTTQKLELVNMLAPTGAIYENEKRTTFGMRPLPELEGKRYMSLNWINANDASQYQIGKVDEGGQDDEQSTV